MIDRLISSLVALSLAFLVWLYVRSRDHDSLDNVYLPVHVRLAPGQADLYELDVPDPCQVQVSFTGPPSRLRILRNLLHRDELHVEMTLAVPENLQNESPFLDTVRVDAADIPVPPGVAPMLVEGHNRIPVTLHRLVERRLPVRLHDSLEDHVGKVTLDPPTVLVRGPREVLDRALSIATQPYTPSAGERETVFKGMISLVRELEGRPIRTTPDTVLVRCTPRLRQQVYELTEVPVQFLCPANFNLKPQFDEAPRATQAGRIHLRVQGPAGEGPLEVAAYIDLTRRLFEPGSYQDEPLRFQLPRDFQLAQKAPHSVKFRLVPIE